MGNLLGVSIPSLVQTRQALFISRQRCHSVCAFRRNNTNQAAFRVFFATLIDALYCFAPAGQFWRPKLGNVCESLLPIFIISDFLGIATGFVQDEYHLITTEGEGLFYRNRIAQRPRQNMGPHQPSRAY